jgi:hypothetical protein
MNDSIIQALTVPFAAGFAVQRFLEILDPLTSKFLGNPITKKAVLGVVSLLIGWLIAWRIPVELFHALLKQVSNAGIAPGFDHFLSANFISAGTEGFNSLLKFAQYKKEATKADAAAKKKAAAANAGDQRRPQTQIHSRALCPGHRGYLQWPSSRSVSISL